MEMGEANRSLKMTWEDCRYHNILWETALILCLEKDPGPFLCLHQEFQKQIEAQDWAYLPDRQHRRTLETKEHRGKNVIWLLMAGGLRLDQDKQQPLWDILLATFKHSRKKWTISDFRARSSKYSWHYPRASVLWLSFVILCHAKGARFSALFEFIWSRFKDKWTLDDFRVQCRSSGDRGKTLVWLLAKWATVEPDQRLDSASKSSKEKSKKSKPWEYFDWVVRRFGHDFTLKDLRQRPKGKIDRGQTVFWLIVRAREKEITSGTHMVLQRFGDFTEGGGKEHLDWTDFRAMSRDKHDNKGVTAFHWVILSTGGGTKLNDLLKFVLDHFASRITLEDFRTKGSHKNRGGVTWSPLCSLVLACHIEADDLVDIDQRMCLRALTFLIHQFGSELSLTTDLGPLPEDSCLEKPIGRTTLLRMLFELPQRPFLCSLLKDHGLDIRATHLLPPPQKGQSKKAADTTFSRFDVKLRKTCCKHLLFNDRSMFYDASHKALFEKKQAFLDALEALEQVVKFFDNDTHLPNGRRKSKCDIPLTPGEKRDLVMKAFDKARDAEVQRFYGAYFMLGETLERIREREKRTNWGTIDTKQESPEWYQGTLVCLVLDAYSQVSRKCLYFEKATEQGYRIALEEAWSYPVNSLHPMRQLCLEKAMAFALILGHSQVQRVAATFILELSSDESAGTNVEIIPPLFLQVIHEETPVPWCFELLGFLKNHHRLSSSAITSEVHTVTIPTTCSSSQSWG